MKLTDFLPLENIIELSGHSRGEVFTELIEFAATKRQVPAEHIFTAIMARENMMSTALGEAVAIPHGLVENLGKPLLLLGLSSSGVADYIGMDGKAVCLIFLLLLDYRDREKHLPLLKLIADKLLNSNVLAEKLVLSGANPGAVWQILHTAHK